MFTATQLTDNGLVAGIAVVTVVAGLLAAIIIMGFVCYRRQALMKKSAKEVSNL